MRARGLEPPRVPIGLHPSHSDFFPFIRLFVRVSYPSPRLGAPFVYRSIPPGVYISTPTIF